jgi:hypothetical protein
MRFDFNDDALIPETVEAQSVRGFFYPKYTEEQLSTARGVLGSYIDAHPQLFVTTVSDGAGPRHRPAPGG